MLFSWFRPTQLSIWISFLLLDVLVSYAFFSSLVQLPPHWPLFCSSYYQTMLITEISFLTSKILSWSFLRNFLLSNSIRKWLVSHWLAYGHNYLNKKIYLHIKTQLKMIEELWFQKAFSTNIIEIQGSYVYWMSASKYTMRGEGGRWATGDAKNNFKSFSFWINLDSKADLSYTDLSFFKGQVDIIDIK